MSRELPTANEVVSNFEQAKDLPSFNTAFQSAVLLSATDQAGWKDAQSQMQNADLSAIGLSGFVIDGLDNQVKNAAGEALPPELELKATNGSGQQVKVDGQGDIFDQAGSETGRLQFANTTDSTSVTSSPGDSSTTTGAASASDNTTAATPAASDSQTASSTDAAATATAFGANGRQMQMSADGNSGSYSVQGGDNLWSIAQDALTPPGQTLTPDQKASLAPEIQQMVTQIAQDNNISDPNEIYPGQQLTINGLKQAEATAAQTIGGDGTTTSTAGNDGSQTTATTAADTGTATQNPAQTSTDTGTATQNPAPTQSDGSTTTDQANGDGTLSANLTPPYTPLALPGTVPDSPSTTGLSQGGNSFLANLQSSDGSTYNPLMPAGIEQDQFYTAQSTPFGPGGLELTVNVNPTDGGVPIQAQEIFDPSGNNLIGSRFMYGGAGTSMNFENANGAPESVTNVTSIENLVQKDGTYASVITDAAGGTFQATIGADGTVSSFGQKQASNNQDSTVQPPAS
jgi:LysM domain